MRKRVWPWSTRNQLIRSNKQLDRINRVKDGATEAISEKPGLLGHVGRTFRRRLLNIFDFGGREATMGQNHIQKGYGDCYGVIIKEILSGRMSFCCCKGSFKRLAIHARKISPCLSGDKDSSPSTTGDNINHMPFAFVRNGVMSAIYWSVGKGVSAPRRLGPRGHVQVCCVEKFKFVLLIQ